VRRIALLPSKDMDRRDYELIKKLDLMAAQSQAGFRQIDLGNSPSGSGQPLNDHGLLAGLGDDDHLQYFLLAGRAGGQRAYGSNVPDPGSINQWAVEGAFTSESSKAATATWSSIAIDTSAAVGDVIILHLVTLPFANDLDTSTSNHSSITDTQGNTWTKIVERTYSDSFGNGCCQSVWRCTVTAALTAGGHTLEATYTGSIGAMAISSHRFTIAAGTLIVAGTVSLGEFGAVGPEPSAVSISGLTPGVQYLFFRATGKGQAGSTVIGSYTPTGGFNGLDHNGSITAGGTGNVGSCGEYQIAALTANITDPQLGAAGGFYSSTLLALAAVPAPDGFLRLASQDTYLAAKIELIDDDIFAYADTFNFLDAGGTAVLSYIRGSDGAFVGPLTSTSLHSSLGGLTTGDDHTQYLLLAGRSGGQVISDSATAANYAALGGVAPLTSITATLAAPAGSTAYNLVYITPSVAFGASAAGNFSLAGFGGGVTPTVPVGITASLYGLNFAVGFSGGGSAGEIIGSNISATGSTTAGSVLTNLYGVELIMNPFASTTTLMAAIHCTNLAGSWTGATTDVAVINIGASFGNNANAATWSGIRLVSGITAAIANKWFLNCAIAPTNMGSKIAHKTAIGWNPSTVSAITAKLHLAAGTTAASTAPLKFTTGPLMTAVEAGAVEHYLNGLFFTPSTTVTRQQVATDLNVVCADGEVVTYDDDLVLV